MSVDLDEGGARESYAWLCLRLLGPVSAEVRGWEECWLDPPRYCFIAAYIPGLHLDLCLFSLLILARMSGNGSTMSSDTFKPLLLKLMNTPGKFTPEDTKLSMRHLATPGCVLPAQAGAFLAALKSSKIEHLPETLSAAAEVMREYAVHVPLDEPEVGAVDMVGTGGDGHNTFNVSTTAAIVAAGAGARVVKVSPLWIRGVLSD